jgi:DNA-binding CsgD family transcriptional regulator/PAS domain-containing protein
MPDVDRRALRLLDLLHDAPGNPEAWTRFLAALRDAISPDAVTIFATNPHESQPGIIAISGLGVRPFRLGEFPRPSLQHPSVDALPTGAVRDFTSDFFGEAVLYRELLAPHGILPRPGLFVVNERTERHVQAATLVLPRKSGWAPTAQDRALLERLAPHMALARRLEVRLSERRRDTEALLAAFDHLALGVVLLSASGRVSYVNRSAAESLELAPGFSDPDAAGSEADDPRTLVWRRLVGADRDWSGSAFVLTHPSAGRSLQLMAAPFGWSDRSNVLAGRFARAVFIGDPRRRTGDPIGVLNEIYGLTPGETRLTLLLLSDCSLEEAARLLGISRSTVRSVLKRIFEKTGTNRQSGLVRLMLTGFAQVRPGDREDPVPVDRRRAGSRR